MVHPTAFVFWIVLFHTRTLTHTLTMQTIGHSMFAHFSLFSNLLFCCFVFALDVSMCMERFSYCIHTTVYYNIFGSEVRILRAQPFDALSLENPSMKSELKCILPLCFGGVTVFGNVLNWHAYNVDIVSATGKWLWLISSNAVRCVNYGAFKQSQHWANEQNHRFVY